MALSPERAREVCLKHRIWERSTGPRTAAGKLRTSMNAVKHGLYSHDPFIRQLARSIASQRVHRQLADSFIKRWDTLTPEQRGSLPPQVQELLEFGHQTALDIQQLDHRPYPEEAPCLTTEDSTD
jgi:hypothetical protein